MIARPAVSAGSIPAGWILKPLKHNLRRLSDKGNGAGKVMALENIEGWTGKELETGSTFDGDGVKFQPDDLLFGKLRPYLAKVFLAREPGDAVGDLWALRPEPACDPKFMFYVLVNQMFIDVVNGSTNGAKMPRAEWSYVGAIGVPTPPHGDQTAIARFLDSETGLIDGLIEKKTRFIALLKEKRAAVITHAVTKGIDPDRDFSSTGIYWAPSVPSHWRISPFRQACWYQEGPGIMAVDFHETGVPLLRISGVQGRYASLDGCNFLDPEKVAQKWRHFRLHEGDLLISASATMGTITEVGEEAVGAVAYTGIIRMKPSDQVTKRFLSYFLGSSIFMEQINLMKQGSTIQHFGPTHLSRVKIPLPPTDEQEAIAADLDRKTSRIDGLITLTERSIDLLREKRAALITAAVTGKIDVRAAA